MSLLFHSYIFQLWVNQDVCVCVARNHGLPNYIPLSAMRGVYANYGK